MASKMTTELQACMLVLACLQHSHDSVTETFLVCDPMSHTIALYALSNSATEPTCFAGTHSTSSVC